MGVNATGTLGGRRSSAEDARIEAPQAARGYGLGTGCAPSQKIYEIFISKWCDMVHSGCVVFKIHVLWKWQRLAVFRSSAGGKKIKHLSKYWGGRQHRTTPAGQILGGREPCGVDAYELASRLGFFRQVSAAADRPARCAESRAHRVVHKRGCSVWSTGDGRRSK